MQISHFAEMFFGSDGLDACPGLHLTIRPKPDNRNIFVWNFLLTICGQGREFYRMISDPLAESRDALGSIKRINRNSVKLEKKPDQSRNVCFSLDQPKMNLRLFGERQT